MDLSTITTTDFKTYFERDFPYEWLKENDINRAFQEAQISFNQSLFTSDDKIRIGYYYLSAHYLVSNIKSAKQGVSSVGTFPVNSRSVGSVSESYTIPDWASRNPLFNNLSQTSYGQKYLSFIMPKIVGNVVAISGATIS